MNLQESIRRILREEKLNATPQELIKNLPKELKELLFKQWDAKQNPEWHPEGNTLKHIIVVIKRAYHHYPDDPNMVMAALFHDLGKMDTYSINPKTNQPTAYGHEEKSTDYVEQFKNWIESFDGTDVDEIKYLVKNHMKVKPSTWNQMKDKKKEPIISHSAFDKLMGFTNKLDGGGTDLKESIRRVLREELLKESNKNKKITCDNCGWSWKLSERGNDPYVCYGCVNNNSINESTYLRRRLSNEKLDRAFEDSLKYTKNRFTNNHFKKSYSMFLNVVIDRMMNEFHGELSNWGTQDFPYQEVYDYIKEKYSSKIKQEYKKLFSDKSEMIESELTEKCWAGYTQKGMKTMFGKRYPNCVKKLKK